MSLTELKIQFGIANLFPVRGSWPFDPIIETHYWCIPPDQKRFDFLLSELDTDSRIPLELVRYIKSTMWSTSCDN